MDECDLISRGFRIGSMGVAFRKDMRIGNDWTMVRAELDSPNAVSIRVYGSTLEDGVPITDWLLLEKTTLSSTDQLDSLLESLFGGEVGPSMLEPVFPISHISVRKGLTIFNL